MPTRKAGNAFLPTRRFSKWSGTDPEPSGILPSALDAKTLPQTTNPSTQPYKKRARTKKQVRATRRRRQTASQLLSKHRMSPLTIQTIPSSRTVWGLLILKEIDEGNCCVLAALDHRGHRRCGHRSCRRQSARPQVGHHRISRIHRSRLFCHRARSWPQHCSPCWAPRILETKLKRSRLSTLQPPPSCVYTPLLQMEARPWNSMATHS